MLFKAFIVLVTPSIFTAAYCGLAHVAVWSVMPAWVYVPILLAGIVGVALFGVALWKMLREYGMDD